MLAVTALFSALAVIQINYLLDDASRATVKSAAVEYKSIHRDIFSPSQFALRISWKSGDSYHVPRGFYDALEEDDTVTIVTRTGALGIPYSFVVPAGSTGETWSP